MSFASLLVLAVGLAMDAAAVAATRGLRAKSFRWREALLLAALFGAFQAGMPLLGWALGVTIGPFIEAWDHWLAFALLTAIGAKMLWESRSGAEVEKSPAATTLAELVVLAIATSVDALAVGITLPLLGAPLLPAIATIGITAALLSFVGMYLGSRFGSQLGRRLDAFGGVVLIAIGARILMQHLLLSGSIW